MESSTRSTRPAPNLKNEGQGPLFLSPPLLDPQIEGTDNDEGRLG